jgi:transposase
MISSKPEVMIMAIYKITLEEEEKKNLLEMVGKGKGGAQSIRRANILLAVDKGEHATLRMTDEEAAKAYHTTPRTVYSVKKAFVEEGLADALGRKERKTPPHKKVTGDVEAKIVAITCSDPPEGHASWSLRLIADTAVEMGVVDYISHVAVGDVLKKTNLSHGYTKNGAYRSAHANS